MSMLLLGFIKGYWRLIPPKKRKKCIFKKSCSHHVYDITKEKGFLKGMKALKFRFKHCRPGYYVINDREGKLLISARNHEFKISEMNERVLMDN